MFELRDEQYAQLRRQIITEKLIEIFQKTHQKATYEPDNNHIVVTDARGNTAKLVFDEQGFIATLISPLGRQWRLENNSEGQLLSLINPAGLRFSFDYNEERDIMRIFKNNKLLCYLDYIVKDYLKTITFADNSQIQFQYNNFLKITEVTDRLNRIERYQYTDEGDLIAVTDGNGNQTRFDYSTWTYPDKVQYADGSNESYVYNPKGLIQKLICQLETIINHITYNTVDQPTEIQYSDGSIAFLSYDEQGRMLEASHREITVKYTYDTEGRVIQEEQGEHIIKYCYDKLGNLTGITYPLGDKVEFAYDPDTRLAFVKDWQQQLHRFIYADHDEGSRQFHPNGLVTTTYQAQSGLPIRIEVKNQATNSELFSLHYQYDDADRIQAFRDSAFGPRHYEYDAESQLLAVKSDQPQHVETYTYDSAGNRVRFNNESVRCNAVNQLTQQGNIRCDYDAQGNMTTIALPGK